MKKLMIAGLLAAALSVTALSGQKAAAWGCGPGCGGGGDGGCCSGGGCWGFGFNFSFTRCGCNTACLHPSAFCSPCSCAPTNICDTGYSGFGYGGYPVAGYPVAPTAGDIQTVGYGYQAGAGYQSYGYNAPSYWYGR